MMIWLKSHVKRIISEQIYWIRSTEYEKDKKRRDTDSVGGNALLM